MSQSDALSEQNRQLEAARHAAGQEGTAAEVRVRAVQQGAHGGSLLTSYTVCTFSQASNLLQLLIGSGM